MTNAQFFSVQFEGVVGIPSERREPGLQKLGTADPLLVNVYQLLQQEEQLLLDASQKANAIESSDNRRNQPLFSRCSRWKLELKPKFSSVGSSNHRGYRPPFCYQDRQENRSFQPQALIPVRKSAS
ncbi:hypothetical protein GX48_00932 [Paracoccidioides brasiliensis]|nr:hypothetical protein GX48_00932 [Paracoccidioides brasiliensis]